MGIKLKHKFPIYLKQKANRTKMGMHKRKHDEYSSISNINNNNK